MIHKCCDPPQEGPLPILHSRCPYMQTDILGWEITEKLILKENSIILYHKRTNSSKSPKLAHVRAAVPGQALPQPWGAHLPGSCMWASGGSGGLQGTHDHQMLSDEKWLHCVATGRTRTSPRLLRQGHSTRFLRVSLFLI